MLKRIWAVVSEPDFYAFQQRAKKDGMDMGQALAALTHAYAKGEKISAESAVKHKERFSYLHEVEGERPTLVEVEQ